MTRRTAFLGVCLLGTLILTAPSLFHTDLKLDPEDKEQVEALVKAHPFLPPASGEFTEKQLVTLLGIVNQLQEFAQRPDIGADSLDLEKARLLREQGMSPEEYNFIADRVTMAGLALDEQSIQMMSGSNDAEMEDLMASMDLSEEDKTAMRKARAEKRKWWKGTPEAPANNLDLASRYEKEINR